MAHARLLRASTPATWSDKVRRSLLETLLRGTRPTVDATARELAFSARQLQLHLKSEETSYTEILDGLRLELAKGYLQRDDLSLCEVTFLLGYAEQSSFNHAFKRWTGRSPTEYRGSVRH